MEEKQIEQKVDSLVKSMEKLVGDTALKAEQMVDPYRQSIFKRFPVLLIGLSTFGIVSVLYGFEKIIDSIPFLADRPLFILLFGIGALWTTGSLYKKLA